MAAASSANHAKPSVHDLVAEWQARAARGEQLDPQALAAALAEATGARAVDPQQTVALPGNQAATVSIRPPSSAVPVGDSPSAAFERLSSRLKALSSKAEGGEPAQGGLADYDLLREVARGGMGVVYEARQKSLNRIVALKTIRAGELADAEDVARFFAEAEAAANLRHPNIVAVYEFGRAGASGEHHYFTMDFVAGPSLLELVRKQPLDGASAARYVAKIARAIQFAHDRGVLHRDLKPANILIGEGDEPLVTDFGLAKRLGTDSGVTIAGTVLGTPSYMPPEQAAGNLGQVGPLSDVYSLGAVLYECVTGRPPFVAADVMDVFRQVMQDEPLPPSRLSPRLPRDLETICLKCLEKDRQRRYASAGALADDLERFLRGEPIAARPVGLLERTIKWARRRPAVAALYGVLAAAVLIVLGVAGYYNHELSDSNNELSATVTKLGTALGDANTQRAKATEQSQLATDRLKAELRNNYATVIQRAEDYWQESPPSVARSRELLASLVPRAGDEDLRGIEWHVLARMCNTDDQRVLDGRSAIQDLTVLPSGRLLAFRTIDNQPVLEWADPDGESGRQLIGRSNNPARMRLAAGSEWAVASGGLGRIELRSRQNPEQVAAELLAESKESVEIAISPDGRRIAWCSPSGKFHVWNVAERKIEYEDELEVQLKDLVSILSIDFSPDGNWLCFCGSRDIFVADLKIKKVGVLSTRLSANLTAAAVAPDGKQLVVSHSDGQIDLFELPLKSPARAKTTFNTLKLSARPQALLFMPPGDTLAVGASNGMVILLDIKTGKARTYRGHTESIACLAASKDGKWLYSGSSRGEVLRWDPAVTDQRAEIVAGEIKKSGEMLAYRCLDYSPDGRWLAIGGRWVQFDDQPPAGELLVLDTATGEVSQRVATGHSVNTCRFTPDSRQIVYGSAQPLTPGQFWLADLKALSLPREILAGPHKLFAAAPLADGKIALAADDVAARVWSPTSSTLIGEWRPVVPRPQARRTEMFNLVTSMNGQHGVAHGEGGLIRLWDVATGRERLIAPANVGQEALAVSPDGRFVAWQPANPVLRPSFEVDGFQTAPEVPWLVDWRERAIVFDVQKRQVRLIVSGHSAVLTAMAFSADSRRLATGDGHGHVKLWDMETGHELLTLEAHLNDVFGIAFHPSGKQMATVGTDGVVRVWPRRSEDSNTKGTKNTKSEAEN